MITFNIDNAVVAVEFTGMDRVLWDGAPHPVYTYSITTDEWSYVGNDLRGGACSKPNEMAAAADLFGFLSAFVEARECGYPDSDNAALFPDYVGAWADNNADEFAALDLVLSDESL